MAQRLDALLARKYTTREGVEKTQFLKIGAAFPTRTGDGFSVVLDAMPAPDRETGQWRIVLMPPLERDGQQPHGTGSRRNDLDGDEVPF